MNPEEQKALQMLLQQLGEGTGGSGRYLTPQQQMMLMMSEEEEQHNPRYDEAGQFAPPTQGARMMRAPNNVLASPSDPSTSDQMSGEQWLNRPKWDGVGRISPEMMQMFMGGPQSE